MNVCKDAHFRSVLKAITWRCCATFTTMVIVFGFTGKLALALEVGSVEVVAKLIIYYMHERIWDLVRFGSKKHPLAGLPVSRPLDEEDMKTIRNQLRDLGYIREH